MSFLAKRKGALGLKDRTSKRDLAYLAEVVTLRCVICDNFGMAQITIGS